MTDQTVQYYEIERLQEQIWDLMTTIRDLERKIEELKKKVDGTER